MANSTAATPDVTFGPYDEQWLYNRNTRTYDLTRGRPEGIKIRTTEGPDGTFITIAPSISALVIVDMQNYFLHPSCRDHPLGLAAVEPTLKVIEKCRQVGIQIIWLNWGLTDADLASMPASVLRGFARSAITGTDENPPRRGLGEDLGEGKGRCLMAGEWNSALYGPLLAAAAAHRRGREDGDVQCAKNRMSGLWDRGQPLWKHLEGSGRRTLLFAGVNTDQCVLGTLADAYNAGWDCVLVEDCCATTTPGAREVCLWNISKSYGFVVNSDTLTEA